MKWISVKEKLPDELVRVLIYVPSYSQYGQDQYVASFCDWEKDICDEWHVDAPSLDVGFTASFPREDVTHWMPLPKFPE